MSKEEEKASAQGAETSADKKTRLEAEKDLSQGKDPGPDRISGFKSTRSGDGPTDLDTGERVNMVPPKTQKQMEEEADGTATPDPKSDKAAEKPEKEVPEYNPDKDRNKAKSARKFADSITEKSTPEEVAKAKKDFASAVASMIEDSPKAKTLTVPHVLGVHVINHEGMTFDPDTKKLSAKGHQIDVVFDDDIEKFDLK